MSKKQSEFSIMMSDAEGMNYYTLLGQVGKDPVKNINCISEYTISGGPETPFEVLSLSIPKYKLRKIAPSLVEEGGIKAGRNKVIVDAVGRGHFTVVKCKYSGRKYKITAYCDTERYRGCTLAKGGVNTPEDWIRSILNDTSYGVSVSEVDIRPGSDAMEETISFESGTTVWYVLQVCAILLGCKIWFSEDKAYVVDCTQLVDGMNLDLYPEDETDAMYARTVGEVSLGSEGTDTLLNSIFVKCTIPQTNSSGELTGGTTQSAFNAARDTQSIKMYGEYKSNTLVVPELREGLFLQDDGSTVQFTQGKIFAENYMKYFIEPQQSVSFEIKELEAAGVDKETGLVTEYKWVSFWDLPAYCTSISDDVDEFSITNDSALTRSPKPEKLLLSTYVRKYPSGTTEYTFGQIKSIDLSSNTSQIVTALYN